MKIVINFNETGQLSYYASLSATIQANPSCTEEECGAKVLAKMRRDYPDDEETLSVEGWSF